MSLAAEISWRMFPAPAPCAGRGRIRVRPEARGALLEGATWFGRAQGRVSAHMWKLKNVFLSISAVRANSSTHQPDTVGSTRFPPHPWVSGEPSLRRPGSRA